MFTSVCVRVSACAGEANLHANFYMYLCVVFHHVLEKLMFTCVCVSACAGEADVYLCLCFSVRRRGGCLHVFVFQLALERVIFTRVCVCVSACAGEADYYTCLCLCFYLRWRG